jgi:hypothetical protein
MVGIEVYPSVHEMISYRPIISAIDVAALALLRGEFAHLVVGARQPDAQLRAALAQTNRRFVMALDDPRNAVCNLFDRSGVELSAVTRAVANSCPLITSYLSMQGALILHADREGTDPWGAAAAIANHFEIAVDAAEVARIVEDLANVGFDLSQAANTVWSDRISEAGRKMVDGALGAYAESFLGRGMGQVIWTREMFMLADDSTSRPTAPIDVSGGTRNLIFGPYIHLPPGSWSARTILGFSTQAAGHNFLVDVAAGAQLGMIRLQPPRGGVFEANITFSLDAQMNTGIEVRVMVGENLAKGELTFGHVTMTPSLSKSAERLTSDDSDYMSVLDL